MKFTIMIREKFCPDLAILVIDILELAKSLVVLFWCNNNFRVIKFSFEMLFIDSLLGDTIINFETIIILEMIIHLEI